MTLTPNCTTGAIVQHELMHSLYHEQSRPDRDKYILKIGKILEKV